MSLQGHLFRGIVIGLTISSGQALAQVYAMCGVGAGTITGNLEVPSAQIEGGIVIDGSIDCGGICGGGGTASAR